MLSLLAALLLCSRCVACKYGSISRFKGVFRGFYGVRVCLCCFGALRGLCGFCARVELGGLKACRVFRLSFSSFVLVFALLLCYLPIFWGFAFVVLCLSSCIVFVGLWVCFFRFFLPCGLHAKRKGAKCFPCVLSCPAVGLFIGFEIVRLSPAVHRSSTDSLYK